jgi:SAM-dependent methyltransferase
MQRKEREQTFFYNMRKFHNNIKRNLYNKYTKNVDSVLELGVGRSGDLDKWISNNIKKVVGYDINAESISEGQRRVNERKSNTKVELYVKDLSSEILPKPEKLFDVVSAQFCFHYFFRTQETFDAIVKSINNNCKYDGYFIGTLFDGVSVSNLELSENGILRFKIEKGITNETPFGNEPPFGNGTPFGNEPPFGNGTPFGNEPPFGNGTPFGNEAKVYLNETILNEPTTEYIVNFDSFVKLMKMRGFELVESHLFKDLYNDKFRLDSISKQVSFLNRTFVFKKTLLCKSEIEKVLIKCEFNTEITEYNKKVYLKYYQSLSEKIKSCKSEIKKKEYSEILSRFEFGDTLGISSVNTSNYIKMLNKKYLGDLR